MFRGEHLFKEEISRLQAKGLFRKMRLLESQQGPRVIVDGRSIINLCSNDYLGLAADERIKEAAIGAIRQYGSGSGAARLVCGNLYLHQMLEEQLAEFKNTARCLVFNSGYIANIGIIAALAKRGDIIFFDRLNHASIVDGILLSRARFRRYAHRDVGALEKLLTNSNAGLESRSKSRSKPALELGSLGPRYGKRLIITDTVFSMDGDIAPLPEIVRLSSKYGCLVMVDEAHATGVLGQRGAGAAEHFGLEDKIDIQMGTLSKAFGSFGAYVAGTESLIEYLINHSRPFIYTTGLPPGIAAASLKALEIIKHEPQLRQRLWDNLDYLKSGLQQIGFNTFNSQTPIIPLEIGDAGLTMEISQRLFESGVFIQGIRPPSVPQGKSRLRLTVTAAHSKADLDFTLEALGKTAKDFSIT